jgi:hypothetical protein
VRDVRWWAEDCGRRDVGNDWIGLGAPTAELSASSRRLQHRVELQLSGAITRQQGRDVTLARPHGEAALEMLEVAALCPAERPGEDLLCVLARPR